MAFVGEEQGASGQPHFASTLGFIVLVGLVVHVVLDLNQPRRGLITVSQEPIRRLVHVMGATAGE